MKNLFQLYLSKFHRLIRVKKAAIAAFLRFTGYLFNTVLSKSLNVGIIFALNLLLVDSGRGLRGNTPRRQLCLSN